MKIRTVSDLHLEFYDTFIKLPDLGSADTIILGGDILCARHFTKNGPLKKLYTDFLNQCVDNFKHIIYVQGNHEKYSLEYHKSYEILKEHLPPSIHLLENDYVKIEEWTFLCCTLWSDFNKENPFEMLDASRFMSDYSSIKIGSNYRKLRPEDTLEFHKQSKQFLIEKLEEFKNDKIWIATHHAPSYQSVHEKYKNDPLNGSFVSDLDDLILSNPQIKYWSHGHVHNPFDYKIGNCRVICNPRGYPKEDNGFNLNLTIDLVDG